MQITPFANTPYASLSAWGGADLTRGARQVAAAQPAGGADRGRLVDASFAQNMLRRLSEQAQAGGDGQAEDAAGLVAALQDSMDYLRENFGDATATAAIGLVYQRVGDGPVTEENLGQGLVAAIRFVDRNFGTAAGDRVLSRFNGDLNDQLNSYFDNGLDEKFLALDAGMSGTLKQVQGVLADLGDQLGEGVADALRQILADSLGEKVDAASLRGAAADMRGWLERQYGPGAAARADALLGSALGGQVPAGKGLLLDLAA
ncbi:MAG: hypothetical protein AB1916_09335 [Thermodesulfobacteriota bacterium]